MRKLVVAGMLGLAAFTGWQGTAFSQPLFRAFGTPVAERQQPVILAQAGDAARIQQLQEEIRQLNGRIEEMSFQLLQMQEQMRKTQEDNEFRFQDLEGGKKRSEAPSSSSGSVATAAPSSGTGAPGADDDVATIIDSDGTGQNGPASSGAGASSTTLGSVRFDAQGNPIGSTMNAPGSNASSLPGVATAAPSTPAAPGSDEDLYKAAYGHVLAGDYAVAEQEFEQYISSFPQGPKIADASFWLGEAQYSQGKYNEAAKTFLDGHQSYGKSPRAPEMLLKLGMSLAALDNPDVACKTLREVPSRYPNASRAVLSKAASEQKRLSC
ncbi:tol-pal system protein YbgF [Rhizobiaceae bacterium BDR2-2]|uniref:Cell division coordinator CpoB n=1 Tax=Ectorhizobium quercum TaxID=2965071 RepID=A0AAE3MYQ5_9HYPH|nr:tol-pal system protein YbgF [Ectorhizobium quercum]MCX8996766.1 tol-pal system protein YbgF [Ectorhizobium quercum]